MSSDRAGALADPQSEQVPMAAAILGAAGLIPFVGLAAGIWVPEPFNAAVGFTRAAMGDALATYAAVILSFMGGVHWGLAMRGPAPAGPENHGARSDPQAFVLAVSVLPALAGWFAILLLAPVTAFAVLAAAFCGLFVYDLRMINQGFAPRWYLKLRLPLTAVVTAALLLTAFALGYGG